MPKRKIRDIIQRDTGDFIRFGIVDCGNKRFALIIESKHFLERFGKSLRIETSEKRLEQLANDILNYLDKKAKLREWKPTMNDFERQLNKVRPKYGIENWFIDWVRTVMMFKKLRADEVKQARRIYEWLHSNRKWLYETKFANTS